MTDAVLSAGLASLGIECSPVQQTQLLRFVDLLQKWNRVYNLTAISGRDRMLTYHVLDSLAILPWIPANGHFLDVGTGAGLPGIPLSILQPQAHWLLLDSNGKKTRFVQQAVAELGLTQVQVVNCRVEDYHAESEFDVILSRAYASLADFESSVSHLCTTRTCLMSMKTRLAPSESAALGNGNYELETIELRVPGITEPRSLVTLKKINRPLEA